MPKYAITYEYTETCSTIISANNEDDAQFLLEQEEQDLKGLNVLSIEEVID